MGLDMWAYRDIFTGDKLRRDGRWRRQYSVRITSSGQPVPGVRPANISLLVEDVMYWHNAAHIHQWFVQNVQDGVDDGKSHVVSEEQLNALLATCEQVIAASELEHADDDDYPEDASDRAIKDASVAKALLPRSPAFPGRYDEHYLKPVVSTRDWIVKMLQDAVPNSTIRYQATR